MPVHRVFPTAPTYSLSTRVAAVAARSMTALPSAVLRVFGATKNSAGNTLDADVAATLRALAVIESRDFADVRVPIGREIIDEEAYLGAGPSIPVGTVYEEDVVTPVDFDTGADSVRVRVYRPDGAVPTAELPTLVYFHGGGWTLGSLDSHDNTCRYFCQRGEVMVISVDYRLAPEHPFPAGLMDCVAVVKLALAGEIQGVDANRVAVGGDSAGGNLAAAVCMYLRDEGAAQPQLQMLFVPAVDLANINEEGCQTASGREFADGYFLTGKHMSWYADHYVPEPADRTHPYVSPLLSDDFSDVPPAYIAVAGFDPLRDEGLAFAEALAKAGVRVTVRNHTGLVHPFVNSMGVWAGARRALDEAVGALRMELGIGTGN
ncbi:alpha/beta hydrolase [Corynebacterium sp. H113]|uniref:alpha/beta hydrolase n=1 Tax=Corynebacterium sp. H113 TaxID=3133419 RepID=UPI0030B62395